MEAFVEGGGWAIKTVAKNLPKIEDQLLKNTEKKGNEFTTYIDLSPEDMDAFMPQSAGETMDAATQKAVKMKVLRGLQENMLKQEKLLSEAMDKQATIKRSIGALKYVLPAALATGALYFPVLGGMAAASAVAWEIKKVLAGIKEVKDNIDRLTTSDYKSAMLLFKDVLISLANNVYPKLSDVKDVYNKAVDGFHKLDDEKIEEKMELIKIQMFCTVYQECFDEVNGNIIPFENVSEDHKNIIRDRFFERLQDIQHLSERNGLDYNSENSFTAAGKRKYQKIVDAIDHVKKTSYSHILIKDTIYQENDFAVKVWSLRIYMVPEGENDSLFSSMNILKPTLPGSDEEITIQASIYKDKGSTWFIKLHLPSEGDYADASLICKFQPEDMDKEAAFFLPSKIDPTSWKIDISFLDHRGMITFYIFKPGQANVIASLQTENVEESDDSLEPYRPMQVAIMKEGFESSRDILDKMSHTVAIVVGFMNLTSSTITLSAPAMTSGGPSEKNPWPAEVPPLSMVNLVTRKTSLSVRGSVGATLLRLTPTLHILLYWSTPFDHNLSQNCFGISCYSGNSLGYSGDLIAKISNLPDTPPNDDGKLHLHWAKDGPVCIDVTDNWRVSVNMTEDHKAVLEFILYNDQKDV